jgi:xylulose-5-phosphate/fructose-6-phosphate phosphoketolase
MLNDLDRFHLVMDVIDRVPGLNRTAAWLRQQMADSRTRARAWTREYGEDIPEVADWTWPHGSPRGPVPRPGARTEGGKALAVPRTQ